MRGFYVRADFATIARLDATVAYVAETLLALGDQGTLDERRVKAVLVLANPTRAMELLQAHADWRRGAASSADAADNPSPVDEASLLPIVVLYAHLGSGGAARVEGMSPVTDAWVRDHLGAPCRFRIHPVIDLAHQAPVDAYEVPDRHRRAVHLMTPADTFPFASNTSRGMQIDHTEEYVHGPGAPPGQSRIGNYGPLVTFHHRIKTHGRWDVQQPCPGLYLWRDPWGAFHLVDPTGTRAIAPAA